MQYTQDYDERLPMLSESNNNSPSWADMIFPYVKSTQIYNCPSHTFTSSTVQEFRPHSSLGMTPARSGGGDRGSYGANGMYEADGNYGICNGFTLPAELTFEALRLPVLGMSQARFIFTNGVTTPVARIFIPVTIHGMLAVS
jgi:hypothetical protein